MGKQRRQRQKLHIAAKEKKNKTPSTDLQDSEMLPLFVEPPDNLFKGIDINFDNLNKDLPCDAQSVKSFKSMKSGVEKSKNILKKDKIKLRRNLLLKKLDVLNEVKKKNKERKKRKNISIIGDTNPLHDALPSLESLLKEKSEKVKRESKKKPRGIEKSKKRKKELVQGVHLMKSLLKNKNFLKDPLNIISSQVKTAVENMKL